MTRGGGRRADAENGGQRVGPQVGTILSQARHALGQSLNDVARDLRIRRTFLEAIEEGQYDGLPGTAYTLGFIRTYAEYLGLEGDEIVRRFKAESGQTTPKSKLNFPSPMSESTAPKAAMALVGLVIAGVAYGIWYLSSSRYLDVAELVVPLPEHLRKMLPGEEQGVIAPVPPAVSPPSAAEPPSAPREVAVAIPPPSAPAPVSSVPSLPAAMPSEVTTAAAPPEMAVAPAAPAVPAAPVAVAAPVAAPSAAPEAVQVAAQVAAPVESPAAALPNRIVLRATADSWVDVREAGNRSAVYARLMKAGEMFPVPDRPGLTLMTGNAGGLEVLVDGQPIPPLGKPGTVRRGLSLDPDALKAAATTAN